MEETQALGGQKMVPCECDAEANHQSPPAEILNSNSSATYVSADISNPSFQKDEFASEIRVSAGPNSFPKETFSWCPPDFKYDRMWFNARFRSLRYASQSFANPKEVFEQGLEILRIHRGNYTPIHPDPKRLQVVWWEFAAEHWINLKEGSSMNFRKEPTHHILQTSDMTPEQQII